MRIIPYDHSLVYDVIGDVHGHYDELRALLISLGYRYNKAQDLFEPHNKRRLIFIGDYIDRGPENLKVIRAIRHLVEQGGAHAILGNHDYNAVHWTMEDPFNPDEYIRRHSRQHYTQHKTFLEEFGDDPESEKYSETIEWFKSLPLYIQIGECRFIHACWQQSAVKRLTDEKVLKPDGTLTDLGWITGACGDNQSKRLLDRLIKGPDERLPGTYVYEDVNGIRRRDSRVAWWAENPKTYGEACASLPLNATFRDAAYVPGSETTISSQIRRELSALPVNAKVFIGHYSEHEPKLLSPRVCCVDYIAKKKQLFAYTIRGNDEPLSLKNFAWAGKPKGAFAPSQIPTYA